MTESCRRPSAPLLPSREPAPSPAQIALPLMCDRRRGLCSVRVIRCKSRRPPASLPRWSAGPRGQSGQAEASDQQPCDTATLRRCRRAGTSRRMGGRAGQAERSMCRPDGGWTRQDGTTWRIQAGCAGGCCGVGGPDRRQCEPRPADRGGAPREIRSTRRARCIGRGRRVEGRRVPDRCRGPCPADRPDENAWTARDAVHSDHACGRAAGGGVAAVPRPREYASSCFPPAAPAVTRWTGTCGV